MRRLDFKAVTELPGMGATAEQLSMLYTRYRLAAEVGRYKDVLEVGCGAGIGLRYLARRVGKVVGGDCDEHLLQYARSGPQVPLVRLDGHTLPFRDRTFDVVILFEALYYFAAPARFIEEARRVLRPGGVLLLCTVNKQHRGFVPSRYARKYLTAFELRELVASKGFSVEIFGGFPARSETTRETMMLGLRRLAAALHLIPSTLQGRSFLKRLAYGTLTPIPSAAYEGMTALSPLAPLTSQDAPTIFKVLYAIARVM